jgi:hypothetical protein
MSEEKKIPNQEGIEKGEILDIPETEPVSIETEENIVSDKEKERRREVLGKIAEEAKNEEDTEGQVKEKETFKNIVERARSGFPIENNTIIVQTLGEKILDPKIKLGARKALEQALDADVDGALLDELKDWCVEHFDELVKAGEILEPQ